MRAKTQVSALHIFLRSRCIIVTVGDPKINGEHLYCPFMSNYCAALHDEAKMNWLTSDGYEEQDDLGVI